MAQFLEQLWLMDGAFLLSGKRLLEKQGHERRRAEARETKRIRSALLLENHFDVIEDLVVLLLLLLTCFSVCFIV